MLSGLQTQADRAIPSLAYGFWRRHESQTPKPLNPKP